MQFLLVLFSFGEKHSSSGSQGRGQCPAGWGAGAWQGQRARHLWAGTVGSGGRGGSAGRGVQGAGRARRARAGGPRRAGLAGAGGARGQAGAQAGCGVGLRGPRVSDGGCRALQALAAHVVVLLPVPVLAEGAAVARRVAAAARLAGLAPTVPAALREGGHDQGGPQGGRWAPSPKCPAWPQTGAALAANTPTRARPRHHAARRERP